MTGEWQIASARQPFLRCSNGRPSSVPYRPELRPTYCCRPSLGPGKRDRLHYGRKRTHSLGAAAQDKTPTLWTRLHCSSEVQGWGASATLGKWDCAQAAVRTSFWRGARNYAKRNAGTCTKEGTARHSEEHQPRR